MKSYRIQKVGRSSKTNLPFAFDWTFECYDEEIPRYLKQIANHYDAHGCHIKWFIVRFEDGKVLLGFNVYYEPTNEIFHYVMPCGVRVSENSLQSIGVTYEEISNKV